MKARQMLLIAVATIVGTVSAGRYAQADDDAKRLQGKWRVTSAQQNGGALHKAMDWADKLFVVIDQDEIRVTVEGTKTEQGAKFTIDPKQNPKQIDFTKVTRDHGWANQLNLKLFSRYKWLDGGRIAPEDGQAQGIYKLEGDVLTLCWRTTEAKEIVGGKASELQVRPSVFQSHLYYHQFLFVLERVKPDK